MDGNDDDDLLVAMSPSVSDRMSRVVRIVEGEQRGHRAGKRLPPLIPGESMVVAVGPPQTINDDGGADDPTGMIPPPHTKVVFPAKVCNRYTLEQDNHTWWLPDGDDCWIQERNNGPVWVGIVYSGTEVEQVDGLTVFAVNGACTPQRISITSSQPEFTVEGIGYWTGIVLVWDAEAGIWSDDAPFDNDVVIFDSGGTLFQFGEEVWAALEGPVFSHGNYGQSGGSGGSYVSELWTAFALLSSTGGSIAGGQVATLRILGYADGGDSCSSGGPGTPYIVDPDTPNILVFIAVVEQLVMPGGPIDVGTLVYLVPKYQVPITGSIPGLPLLPSYPGEVEGVYQGYSYVECINDTSGIESLLLPFEGGVEVSLPVFVTTRYPAAVRIQCGGSPPADNLLFPPS
jgi:hypothetical protein